MLIVGIAWHFSVFTYNDNINKRFEIYKPLMFKVEDFEGMICTKYEFPSDKNQMLAADSPHQKKPPRGLPDCRQTPNKTRGLSLFYVFSP